MPEHQGIIHKINRAFLLQGLLIAVAAILGVFFAKIVIEQILIKSAVEEEKQYFWQHYRKNPAFPLPDTKNMTGYFDARQLPEKIRSTLPLAAGFHEFGEGDQGLVLHISSYDNKTLYLVYYRGQVDALVLYYGIFPLFTVLLILYLSLWLTYRFNRRTVSPIIRLAREIHALDLNQADFSRINEIFADSHDSFDADNEIQTLSDALMQLGERLNDFIERERNFTRDASHELRSPLTVLNIAADMLLSEQQLPKFVQNLVLRIKRAIEDMEQLTEVFLLLARENDAALPRNFVTVNEIVAEEIEQANIIKRNKNVSLYFQPDHALRLWASDKVLSVLLGNLIRNAVNYTDDGEIHVEMDKTCLIIRDNGPGMEKQQVEQMFKPFQRGENPNAAGYGIGLTIVKRLCARFHWPITVQSEPGKGTLFSIDFSDAEIIATPESATDS